MSETIQANQGAVTSIGDTDLVMCVAAGGGYRPISFSNLMAAIKGGIQIGGRNLLRNSDTSVENTSFHMTSYAFGKDLPAIGEVTTVTIWGNLGAGKTHFSAIYAGDNGNYGIGQFYKVKDGIYRGQFVRLMDSTNRYLYIFAMPNGINVTSKIYRVKLERGNVATDWTPAPEDIASGTWGG